MKPTTLVHERTPREGLNEQLRTLGVSLISIPAPTGDEKLKLEGWREILEQEGQELWRTYHWIVDAQNGSTHGVYRLRDWLVQFNVPDETNGEHWAKARDTSA